MFPSADQLASELARHILSLETRSQLFRVPPEAHKPGDRCTDCRVWTWRRAQELGGPVTQGRQRASGLRFADARTRPLLEAIILFRQLPDGFRSADLRHNLAALSASHAHVITHGATTYQLRRLRFHGLIERVPKSFRYRVTDLGLRVALFFTRAYNRLLRPGLAAALPDLRALPTPLKRAFNKLDTLLGASINQLRLAA